MQPVEGQEGLFRDDRGYIVNIRDFSPWTHVARLEGEQIMFKVGAEQLIFQEAYFWDVEGSPTATFEVMTNRRIFHGSVVGHTGRRHISSMEESLASIAKSLDILARGKKVSTPTIPGDLIQPGETVLLLAKGVEKALVELRFLSRKILT